MRRLQVQLSPDGFIAGPDNETDWMTRGADNEFKEYVQELTRPVDCKNQVSKLKFKLNTAALFGCGITLLRYKPAAE